MMEVFEKGMPKSMNIFRLLDKKNKKEIKNVMNFLGLEGELEDVMEEENPLPTLLKIQTLMDIYDDVFYGDLKLD
jgi:phage-related tail protein